MTAFQEEPTGDLLLSGGTVEQAVEADGRPQTAAHRLTARRSANGTQDGNMLDKQLSLGHGTARVLAVALLLAGATCGCARPTRQPTAKGQYRGFLRLGPESMTLQPCDTPERSEWWWDFEAGSGGWKGVEGGIMAESVLDAQPRCDLYTLPCEWQEVYVEIDGRLSEKGHFGHMGGYERELIVKKVWYASLSARGPCGQPK